MATEAAAEGLNLQRTARYLLHYDCPWNPSRLEQRNGRLDRHGQARDVTVHHFVSDQDQDLRFLSHIIAKAHDIREDLGSANEIFDEAAHRKLVDGDDLISVQADLDNRVETARGRSAIEADDTLETASDEGQDAGELLKALASEIDLTPDSLRDTLEAAMAIHAGRPQLDCVDTDHTCKLLNPSLPGWHEVIDDSLRISTGPSVKGPVPRLAFSPEPFLKKIGQRLVFNPRPDVLLMHLSHPMLQRALSALIRCRFPGTGDSVSRWTVRLQNIPKGIDALVLLSVEDLAVNELRETFHHWVRTIVFPVKAGEIGKPMPHQAALCLRDCNGSADARHYELAEEVITDVEPKLKAYLSEYSRHLSYKTWRISLPPTFSRFSNIQIGPSF